ncbi:hypothetical protein CSOJ01_11060 [Colletotrichum sojae]|uniref:Uncharacterized protein n=1 Tax=Colletotrichum sojae TaxID=2175907 RepID=A0A8H6MP75_9PEZI|nr:hypothetical protein CSOJ01_11060 [Colletotrichum sojae]
MGTHCDQRDVSERHARQEAGGVSVQGDGDDEGSESTGRWAVHPDMRHSSGTGPQSYSPGKVRMMVEIEAEAGTAATRDGDGSRWSGPTSSGQSGKNHNRPPASVSDQRQVWYRRST